MYVYIYVQVYMYAYMYPHCPQKDTGRHYIHMLYSYSYKNIVYSYVYIYVYTYIYQCINGRNYIFVRKFIDIYVYTYKDTYEFLYRVAKTHWMPYRYRPFFAKEPYN